MDEKLKERLIKNTELYRRWSIDENENIKDLISNIKKTIPVCDKEHIKAQLGLHFKIILLLVSIIIGTSVYIIRDNIIRKADARIIKKSILKMHYNIKDLKENGGITNG